MKISMRLFPRRHRSGQLIWYIEFDRGRKRSTHCEVGTEDAEARRLFKLAKRDYLAGKLARLSDQPSRLHLSEFIQEYLAHGAKLNKAQATLQADRLALHKFLDYAGAQVRLADISRRLVEAWLADLTVKPVSKNTYFRHLKAALAKAVEWDYLKKNPCTGLRQIRDHEPPPRCLSAAEIDRLLTAEADPRYRLLWRFYLATGCRRAEALQIRVEDIDWTRRTITIARAKGKRGKVIVITPEVEAVLQDSPVELGKLWPWRPDTVSHQFQRTAKAAGLQARLHDLRHTYGTMMAAQGLAPWILQMLMGHRDLKTTQKYVHLRPENLIKEVK